MTDFYDPKSDQIFSREPLKKRAAPIWRDLRLLVAVQLYILGRISSDRAAKLADVPHVEFLLSLGFYKVFPLQGELVELERGAHQAKIKAKEQAVLPAADSKSSLAGAKGTPAGTTPKDTDKASSEYPPRQETQEKP